MKNETTIERASERELVVTRIINGRAKLVFEAWTKPELMRKWWVPRSCGLELLSCKTDVRVGGQYRLVFAMEGQEMACFGRYLEVTPYSRLVWTNEEGGDAGQVSTATFEEQAGKKTLLTVRELYPSKEALDAARASGVEAGTLESFDQLDEFIAGLA